MAESCNALSKECVTWALFNYKLQKTEKEKKKKRKKDRKLYAICPDAPYVFVL